MRRASATLLCTLAIGGCGEPAPDATVRAGKWIDNSGRRGISYQVLYDDGVETYIDFEPLGSADLITVERASVEGGAALHLVREGLTGQVLPADGPEPRPIDAAWDRTFERISAMVDTSAMAWSPSEHSMEQYRQPVQGSPNGDHGGG